METAIIHRDDLHLGGFAGLREHRLVMAPRLWGEDASHGNAHPGLGNFVYMADARFNPKGDTRMHPHQEIDVISIMLEGRLIHEGSMAHGQELTTPAVQVQRAGGEGFSHNEVNPDEVKNRMLQLWVLPDQAGEKADYRLYQPLKGTVTRVHGGEVASDGTAAQSDKETKTRPLNNHTLIDVGLLNPGQEIIFEESFIAYVALGRAMLDGNRPVLEGDLLSGDHLNLKATSDVHLVVIRQIH